MNIGLTNSFFAKTKDTNPEPRNAIGPNKQNMLISLINIFAILAESFAIIIAGSMDQAIMMAKFPMRKRKVPRLNNGSFSCPCKKLLRLETHT